MKRAIAIAAFLLTACATAQTGNAPVTTPAPAVNPAPSLPVALHADLQAAAAYAEAHGYPARAAVWRAQDARLTAIEGQIKACADAIKASSPQTPTAPAGAGVFTGVEIAAETVANFSVTAAVKANCEPLPIITLPALPKLP